MSALGVFTLALLSLVVPSFAARAADFPLVTDPVYFQTQGPNALITRGDYYSATVAQGGAGSDHMISFTTPLFWPSGHPITVSIYDPESSGGILPSGLPAYDEIAGTADSTRFWVVQRPSGTTLATKNYASGTTATNNKWDQIVTFTPVAGATYEIHATSSDDDDNAWRARVTYDPDCAVGTATCTAAQLDSGNEVDNIDGLSGTGDEIALHPVRLAYQHDISPQSCSSLYYYVPEGTVNVSMRNFDLDDSGSVLYTRPDGTTVNGTTSTNGAWANDTVAVNGAANYGWWRVQFCATPTNLYVFESTTGTPLYPTLPGAPRLAVTKSDGLTVAEWGQALNYSINVANTSNLLANPGTAVGVTVRDTIPTGLTYTGCSMGSVAGTCSQAAGVVTWTLTNPIPAGTSVNLGLSTTVNWGFSGTVTNTAIADYNDVYGNNYPDVSGTDVADTIQPPTFVVAKTSDTGGALVEPGSQITYSLQIQNPTTSGHTNVTVTDPLPAGTTYVPGSTVVTLPAAPVATTATDNFGSGGYAGGTGWAGAWTETGETTNAGAGFVTVAGGQVRITNATYGVQRTVNVAGATSASLTFGLGSDGNLRGGDTLEWGVSVDGGAFQLIGSRSNDPAPNPTTTTVDLTSYLPATTITPMFRQTANSAAPASAYFSLDNVTVTATGPGSPVVRTNASGGTLASGVPPTLVTAADAINLAAGQSMTVTYKVNVTDPIALSTQRYIVNTATVKSTQDTVGRQGTVTDELNRKPLLQVVKTGPASAIVGDTVTYNFAVSHAVASDGSPVSAVTISDNVAGTPTYVSGDDGDSLLETGETWTYTKNYTILVGDARPLINTVTVGGTDLNGQAIPAATANHSTAVSPQAPSISLTKTTPNVLTAGGTITYTLTAQNTGNVPLTGVQISEGLSGATLVGTCPTVSLAPAASTSCTFRYVATQADVDAGSLTNSASAVGTPPTGAPVSDTDAVTLTATAGPALTLTKTTTDSLTAGGTINYSITATNTGNVTLTGVQISENLAGATVVGTCSAVTLAPGASQACTFRYVATQADVDSGSLTNAASVVGTPPTGAPVSDTDAVTLTATAAPAISLTKTTTDSLVAGGTVTYDLTATNTGNVTLTGVQITEGLAGTTVVGTCDPVTLAPGASTSCTVEYTATQDDIDSGSLTNSALVVGTPPTGDDVTDTDAVTLTSTAAPEISLTKTTTDSLVAGGMVTYDLTATNTGNVTLTGVQITEGLAGTTVVGTCDPVALAPGASTSCTVEYTATQADVDSGSLTNSASVVGTPPTGDDVTDTDAVTLTATAGPAITLSKTTTDSLTAGGTINYSITATNTGNVTLTGVQISENLAGATVVGTCSAVTLAPGASQACTFRYVATQADVDSGSLTNAASVVGTPPTGAPVSDTDAVTLTATAAPAISLTKTTTDSLVAGGTVTYDLTATNTGNVTLTGVQITEGLAGTTVVGTCDPVTLAPGASTSCTVEYTATQDDIDSGSLTNSALVVGTPPTGDDVTDTDAVTLTSTAAPEISLTKTTTDSLVAGGTVTYDLTATNTGNVTLTNVQITENLAGTTVVGTCDPVALAPGASTSCTVEYTATQADVDSGSLTNSASVVGTPPTGDDVTDTDAVTLTATAGPAITLSKTTTDTLTAGGTINYSITATNTGNVTLTGVQISENLAGATVVGTCSAVTLAPGASQACTFRYVATQADVDSGSLTNAASVVGTPPTGAPVSDTDAVTLTATAAPAISLTKTTTDSLVAGGTVTYDLTATNTGNVTLTGVQITEGLAGATVVGTCPAVDLAPGASTSCTVEYVATQADVDSGSLTNSASVVGTPPTGDDVTDTDAVTLTAAVGPAITLSKTTTDSLVAGGTVTYDLTATNTGNVTLTNVQITEGLAGTTVVGTCDPVTLAPGASTSCTVEYVATQADVDSGSLTNSASVVGTPPTGDDVAATDAVTLTATAGPVITLSKTTTDSLTAGGTVTYDLTATNTGNVTLTNVQITEGLAGATVVGTCPAVDLAPGASTSCTVEYVATQADVDSGSLTNSASVVGTPPTGDDVTDTDAVTLTAAAGPAITLSKTTTDSLTAGGTVTYDLTATNTGNVTLTGVQITEGLAGTTVVGTCPAVDLAPGASTSCTVEYVATQADVDAGSLTNSASVVGTPPTGDDVTDTDAVTLTAAAGPAITLSKTTTDTLVAGGTVTYDLTATNTGNVTLTGVQITEGLAGAIVVGTCPAVDLAPGASTSCTVEYTATQADVDSGSLTNSASVVGTPPTGDDVTDTDAVTLTATAGPAITLSKTTTDSLTAGGTVTYDLTATNTGNVTLTGVQITEGLAGTTVVGTCDPVTLAPGASTSCTVEYTATQADVDSGSLTNSASVVGTPPTGDDVTDTDAVTLTATAGPAISLSKTTTDSLTAGGTVTYDLTATNTGNVTLTGVQITENLAGTTVVGTCPAVDLAPGASTSCTVEYTATQADVDSGSLTNSAEVVGTPPTGDDVTDTDAVTLTAAAGPAITLSKTTTDTLVAGGTVTYDLTATNTGNVTLTNVQITEGLAGATVVGTCPAVDLAPGASTSCTVEYVATQADVDSGSLTNSALVVGTPPTGDDVTDTDAVTLTAAAGPAITLSKTTTDSLTAGGTVTYDLTATNTGNVTLTGVQITEGLAGATVVGTCPAVDLAPGASTSCTVEYTATQADVDSGSLTNSAEVVGTPPTGDDVTDTDAVTLTATAAPAISLTKTTTDSLVAGGTVTYDLTATNTGNVTLTGVQITEGLAGATVVGTCPAADLAPGASTSCTVEYTATQADVDSGSLTNSASVVGTPPTGDDVTDTDAVTMTAAAGPAITLSKTTADSLVAGGTVTYDLTATNTGNVTLTGVQITENLAGTTVVGTCPAVDLAPGASTSCTVEYTATQDDIDSGSLTNSASVVGTPPTGDDVTDTDAVTLTAAAGPAITLSKTTADSLVAGGTVTYDLTATNTGNVTLTGVQITEGLAGTTVVGTCDPVTLAPGASTSCTVEYTATQADVDSGSLTNSAEVVGTPPTGDDVTDTDVVTLTAAAGPAITLSKTTTDTLTAGGTVTYDLTATNTGNVTLTNVQITEGLAGATVVGTCPAVDLAPGASTSCTVEYTATQDDIDSGSLTNSASVVGTPPTGDDVTDTDAVTLTAAAGPAITLTKTTTDTLVAGGTVTYDLTATNTGNVTLTNVQITEGLAGTTVVGTCDPVTLAPGASTSCTVEYTATQADVDSGSLTNSASVVGTPPTGDDVTDTDAVTLTATAGPAITLSKTTTDSLVAGGTVTYDLTATNTGNVTLTGVQITEGLAGATVVGTCPAADLAPGASTSCTVEYVATQADVDSGSLTNSASVVGTPPTGDDVTDTDAVTLTATAGPAITLSKTTTDSLTAGGTVTYDLTATNTGNVTLTGVQITEGLAGATVVGTCPAVDLAPGASTSCTVDYTATQADVDSGSLTNSASVVGTPPTGDDVTDTDAVTLTAAAGPAITLSKTTTDSLTAGGTVTYELTATNTGNVTLTNVQITEGLAGATVVGTCPAADLAPGASTSCTVEYVATQADVDSGSLTNSASVVGTPPTGDDVTDTDAVTLTATAGPVITLTKTTTDTLTAGGTVTYDLTATNTGNVTLTNVQITENLAGTSVVGTCDSVTLAPGASTSCTVEYTATQADVDSGSLTNSAEVVGTPPTGDDVTDTDAVTLTAASGPAITLSKTTTDSLIVGGTVTYDLTATNTGNVTLTNVQITEGLAGATVVGTCPAVDLAPGASTSCTVEYVATQADVDSGSLTNSASVVGTPPTGDDVTDTDAVTLTATAGPAITLSKTTSDSLVAGGTVTYDLTATNTGNVTLTGVQITEGLAGATVVGTCPAVDLAPGASTSCTVEYTATQADVDSGSLTNSAEVVGTPPTGDDVTDTDAVTLTSTAAPAISLSKTTTDTLVAGGTVTYDLTATNTGNVTLTGVQITEGLAGTTVVGTCNAVGLVPGASTSCTVEYVATQADVDSGSLTNSASVVGTPPTGDDVTDTDAVTLTATAGPAISLSKTTTDTLVAGGTVTYDLTATNTGNVTLTGVQITEGLAGTTVVGTCPAVDLAPGASTSCTVEYTATQADVDSGSLTNSAEVVGTPPTGDDVTDTDAVTLTAAAGPAITLSKTTTDSLVAGGTVTYDLTATNTGNVTLTNVQITEGLAGTTVVGTCPAVDLAPGASTSCTVEYTATQADVDSGSLTNSASVVGTPPTGDDVTDTDAVTLTSTAVPAISLSKTTTDTLTAGGTVTYDLTATNTGNVTLTNVQITEGLAGTTVVGTCDPATLAPGASTSCTVEYTATQADVDSGSLTNSASVVGTPPTGDDVTDTDAVTLTATAGPAITLSKTTTDTLTAGGTVTYDLTATNTGNVTLTGVQITENLTGTTVVGTCDPVTLAPGASTSCTVEYTATQADVDSGSLTNSASVVGTPPTGDDVTDTDAVTLTATAGPAITLSKTTTDSLVAGGTVTYDLTATNTGNVTLTNVQITENLAGTTVVGTCPAVDLAPGASTSCTVEYTATQADVDSGSLTNSASVVGTPPTGDDVTDTDAVTLTAAAGPAITLSKTTTDSLVAGGTVTYDLTATSTGNVTLTGVQITEGLAGAIVVGTCPEVDLAPGASTSCTVEYVATQADVDSGSLTNSASVVGTPPTGDDVTDTDAVTLTATAGPAITLTKTTTDSLTAGGTVTYDLTATNTGNVTLTGVQITEGLAGATVVGTCPAVDLAPGASTSCTVEYTATQADVDSGSLTNSASVVGTPPTGDDVTDTDAVTLTATAGPAITLTKTTTDTLTAGGTVTYDLTATNTGNVTLTGVQITEGLAGTTVVGTCPAVDLAPGASTSCTVEYTATQADVDSGSLTNSASVVGTPPTGDDVTDTDAVTLTAAAGPAITLSKTTTDSLVAGGTVTYDLTATNTGNVTLTNVQITEGLAGATVVGTCPAVDLAPGASTSCTVEYVATQADVDSGSLTNSALVVGTPPTGDDVTDTDAVTLTAAAGPAITLSKTTTDTLVAGGTVTYDLTATNTGNVTLTNVQITEGLAGATVVGTCPAVDLAPGASTSCTVEYVATQADVDSGSLTNSASVVGTPPIGDDVTDTDAVTLTATAGPAITLSKTTSDSLVAGGTVTYDLTATNTGNVTLTGVQITEGLAGATVVGTCPAVDLAPGASTSCTVEYTATQADVDSGSLTNSAEVVGTPPTGDDVTDTDAVTLTAAAGPAITLSKTTTDSLVAGGTVTYDLTATNTGNVTLTGVQITEGLAGTTVVGTCDPVTLAPGASTSCTVEYTATQADVDSGSLTNSAEVVGTPPTGDDVTDTDAVTLTATAGPAIALTKTTADSLVAGGTVTYDLTATNTGNVTLTGVQITEGLAGATVVGTCPAADLAPGASTSCTVEYTATQADVDSGSLTNSASVVGTPPTGDDVTDTDAVTLTAAAGPAITLTKTTADSLVAGGTVTYDLTATNTGNVTLTGVQITENLAGTTVVGTCPAVDLAPGASTSCTVEYTATQADVDSGSLTNSASVVGTPPTGDDVTDTDAVTLTAAAGPAITLTKTTTDSLTAGGTVTYDLTATNTGNVTLTSVQITENLAGTSVVGTCDPVTLAPGASTSCTVEYTATQADVDSGSLTNSASVVGTPPTGDDVTDTDAVTLTATAGPAITLSKTTTDSLVAGGTVTYDLTATNTGNVTLTGVQITEGLAGATVVGTCPAADLAPGASTSCTVEYTATQDDIDSGSLTNSASVVGTPPTGDDVTDTDAVTLTATAGPAITLSKTTTDTLTAGGTVTYDLTATNTGNVTLTGVQITENLAGTTVVGTCPAVDLAPGASTSCTVEYVATQADVDSGSLTNSASVVGTPPTGDDVTDTDAVTLTAAAGPAITLSKTTTDSLTAGGTVTYDLTATNTGNVTLTNVQIAEGLAGTSVVGTCDPVTLAPGASTSCTVEYTATQADVDSGSLTNSASVVGTPPTGDDVTDTDAVTLTATAGPAISLSKTTTDSLTAGGTVTYDLTATNTGNVTLTSVQITENLAGTSVVGTCDPVTLAPGASTSCTVEYVATQADVDSGSLTNSASVVGTPPTGDDVTDTDAVTLTATAGPAITLSKTTTDSLTAGGTVTYDLTATNTGNVTLTSVQITENLAGTSVVGTCDPVTLAPGASTSCTVEYVATQADVDAGSLTNSASVVGTPPTGDDVTDTDAVTLTATAGPAITLTKTTTDTLTAGGTVTYDLTATNTGNVTLTGVQITEGLAGATVVGTCPAVDLAPGASTSCTVEYTATQADVDSGSLTNSASVVGTPPTGDDVTDTDAVTLTAAAGPAITLSKSTTDTLTAGGTVTYDLTATNTGNVTLTGVQITENLAGTTVVGTCPAVDLAPGASTSCTVEYTATQADVDSGSLTNSASVVGTPPTGDDVTDTDAVTLTSTAAPAITLSKTTTDTLTAGGTVTYDLTATNTGNVTLTGVQITEGLAGTTVVGTCDPVTLAPGASTSCTVEYTATQADVDSGSLTNSASVVGTPPTGDDVTDTDAVTLTAAAGPAITLSKTTTDSLTAGGTVTYDLTATNTGNVTLTGVQITEGLAGATVVGTCPAVDMAPGASTSCTVEYVATQADVDAGSLTNSASVVGTPPTGDDVTDTDAVTLTAAAGPAITLTKTTSATSFAVGDVVTYDLTATNTGNVTLSGVTIADTLPGVAFVGDCLPTTLVPGAALVCTATYTATPADVDAGSIVNEATTTGTPPSGPPVSATASATVETLGDPAIDVSVTVNRPQYGSFGEVLTFTVVTTNTGNVTLYHTTLDSILPGADASECDAVDVTLAPGDSITCLVRYTVVLEDLYLPQKKLDVVATGQSNVSVTVTATSAASATPVTALAFTGYDATLQGRNAAILFLSGLALIIVVRRRRKEEQS